MHTIYVYHKYSPAYQIICASNYKYVYFFILRVLLRECVNIQIHNVWNFDQLSAYNSAYIIPIINLFRYSTTLATVTN